jgi:homopolymeric O-antigen transport system ATP-binding protein
MSIILKIENISKQYRLGLVGTGSLGHDLNRFLHRVRGKEDPYLKVGAVSDRSAKATEDYVWALRDINFEVEEGEVLGIIGKNGAGKSTLLKLLSRVTSPTTGIIKSRGRIASLLEVGTGFHPELTGRENIYLNGAILGMTKAEIASKIDEIIDFSGCELYIDTPTKRYSSGMTVRLAFAVAAHLEPDILVIDEVLAVGDAEFQKKAIGKMQDISSGEGRTVLFVSHNMASVKQLCTRAIVLGNGCTVFEGKTNDAIDYYLNTNSSESNFHYKNDTPNPDSDILEVTVVKNDRPSDLFAFNDSVGILFKLKISKNDLNARLGLKVKDQLDRNIFSTNIELEDFIESQGEYLFKMVIPDSLLAPNYYRLFIGLHVFKKYMIRKLDGKIHFKIEETGSKFQNHVRDDIGCVIINCDWDLISS